MTSLITHLEGEFSDTNMDKLVRDKAISKGTRLLFDFKNSYSNPNPDGPLKFGAVFTNLVDGAPGAVIGGADAAALINERRSTGGIRSPASGANGQLINLGKSYSLHATNPSFIALAWVKCPSNAVANAYQGIFKLQGSSVQNTLFSIDTGFNGRAPRVVANNQNNVPVYEEVPGFTTDAVHQIGVAWRLGFIDVILNGVVVKTITNINQKLLDLSGYDLIAQTARQSTTLHRILLEDLTVAGRTAAQAASADFAAGKGGYT